MSENLLIKEGQIGRKFSPVDRLRVNNQGGGSSLWRNAEELEMDSLEVSKNGLYVALDEELYAYDTITVDVQEASEEEKKTGKTVVGKDPTTGDDHAVGVDEDGNLTEERIPSKIHIVVPPRKLNYKNGETIDYSGIHVYLTTADNTRFTSDSYPTGEIPFEELVFPVTIAETEGEGPDHPTAKTDDTGEFPFSYSSPTYQGMDIDPQNPGTFKSFLIGAQAFTAWQQEQDAKGVKVIEASDTDLGTTFGNPAFSYVHNGKTVYYYTMIFANTYYGVSPVVYGKNTSSVNAEKWAWAMIYGEITGTEEVEIPVQWIRPQDGETLEDTFKITFVPAEEEPDPEPEPDPYADSYDFEYQGAKYNFNRSDIRGMSFSGGYVLVTYMDTMQTYTVEDALKYNLIVRVRVSSTHSGGDF